MRYKIYYLLLIVLITSCNATKESASTASIQENSISSPYENSVLWHQTSLEYAALCHQAFNIAKERINELRDSRDDEVKPKAVIMDLDETVLDNSPYVAKLVQQGQEYSQETWKEWTKMANAQFVPGAYDFLLFADELEIPVYFISNREMDELESTMENLNKLGYTVNDRERFLFSDGDMDKEERRNRVMDQNQVILFIGDNILDFSNELEELKIMDDGADESQELMEEFGQKYIILPNAMYGSWLEPYQIEEGQDKKGKISKFRSY